MHNSVNFLLAFPDYKKHLGFFPIDSEDLPDTAFIFHAGGHDKLIQNLSVVHGLFMGLKLIEETAKVFFFIRKLRLGFVFTGFRGSVLPLMFYQ